MKFLNLIASLPFLFFAGCDAPEPPPSPVIVDDFSGKTVSDPGHAVNLIKTRSSNAPRAGEMAPDATVYDPESERNIRLSSIWKDQPAVLIFGSASCSSISFYAEDINQVALRFGDRVGFYFIYSREAHPKGGFMPPLVGEFRAHAEQLPDPRNIEGRRQLADELKTEQLPALRFLVDTLHDEAAARWAGWPNRIFVVDPDGKVAYSGDHGPWYFAITKESEGWHDPPPPELEAILSKRGHDRISLEKYLEERYP